jgi:hypothetical protein
MRNSLIHSALSLRALGAAALLIAAVFSSRADAISPVYPGGGPTKAAANGPTIEVRGGYNGGGGGGGRGAGGGGGGIGGFSGGHGFAPGGFSGAGVRGGAVGAGRAIVAAPTVAGTPRFAGHIAGGPGFAGHRFHHRHFRGVFVGGVYYDDYSYDYPDYSDYPDYAPVYSVPVAAPAFVAGGGCYRVLTVHGPRVVCHRAKRHYHGIHRRHRHRGHHRA